jgi:hypothetical protein
MVVTRKKPVSDIGAFIDAAPDAVPMFKPPAPAKPIKTAGNKSIITLSISPDVLTRLDAWAAKRGMSRAAAVSFAVSLLD